MADIDIKEIVKDCIASSKQILGDTWNELKPYADHEYRQFAENAEFLAKLKIAGQIDNTELQARLDIQRLALKNVLLTIKGIGLIAAQNVINAITGIVFAAIESALSIVLPV